MDSLNVNIYRQKIHQYGLMSSSKIQMEER
jgi:hypothetical protein